LSTLDDQIYRNHPLLPPRAWALASILYKSSKSGRRTGLSSHWQNRRTRPESSVQTGGGPNVAQTNGQTPGPGQDPLSGLCVPFSTQDSGALSVHSSQLVRHCGKVTPSETIPVSITILRPVRQPSEFLHTLRIIKYPNQGRTLERSQNTQCVSPRVLP